VKLSLSAVILARQINAALILFYGLWNPSGRGSSNRRALQTPAAAAVCTPSPVYRRQAGL